MRHRWWGLVATLKSRVYFWYADSSIMATWFRLLQFALSIAFVTSATYILTEPNKVYLMHSHWPTALFPVAMYCTPTIYLMRFSIGSVPGVSLDYFDSIQALLWNFYHWLMFEVLNISSLFFLSQVWKNGFV